MAPNRSLRTHLLLLLLPVTCSATYHCDNGHRAVNRSADATPPAFHFYPDTIESQDISAPIKIGDTWHVFMDCVPEGCPALVQPVQDKPLSWCHFSSTDLVHWAEHPIAIAPDHDFDGSIIDTGAIFQHPNGTVLAIYATSNVTSNLPSGTFDGDICLAVSEDAGLLTWRKICKQPNGRITNPTCHWCRKTCPDTCKANENSSAPSPFPGIAARMAHRDPVAPWLDACHTGSSELCWYAMSGSGGSAIPGNEQAGGKAAMVLWKTDYLISTSWQFVKIFWNSPGSVYSCPDFFRLPDSDVFVFANLDSHYWVGEYGHDSEGNPAFLGPMDGKTAAAPNGSFPLGIFKTGGVGANNAVNKTSRRIFWGTIGWCNGDPLPSEDPMRDSLHVGSVAALPRDLTARADGNVGIAFVPELAALRINSSHVQRRFPAGADNHSKAVIDSRTVEIKARFGAAPVAHEPYGVLVLGDATRGGVGVQYDPERQVLSVVRTGGMEVQRAPRGGGMKGTSAGPSSSTGLALAAGEALDLHVFVDGPLVEVVANGRASLAVAAPVRSKTAGGVYMMGATPSGTSVDAWALSGIW